MTSDRDPDSQEQHDRPLFMRRLSTDEYVPPPYERTDRRVIHQAREDLQDAAGRRHAAFGDLADGRAGVAAGLIRLNEEWGETFYEVPPEAVLDDETASAAFEGPELVIDVHTHFAAPHADQVPEKREMILDLFREVMPDFWQDLDGDVGWDLATYIDNVFLRTENAVAVLTSGPGLDDSRSLFNDELAATRAIVERFAGTGRLLNHSLVHADIPAEVEAMEQYRDEFNTAGWKVYTQGRVGPGGFEHSWALDDEEIGLPFLERARELGVHLVCSHKGISQMAENGSPRDIGPAAKAFPDLTFLVYHSGYELPIHGAAPEGPYTEATRDEGVNRLIASAIDAGIGQGGNVYADLGTTWFSLVRRPVEAAHVLGKLMKQFGPDRILWGTDSAWYGAAQPLLDAFRTFQIPESMCEEFGYTQLTAEDRQKILSRNAADVYGIDLDDTAEMVARDDLSWARDLMEDYRAHGAEELR